MTLSEKIILDNLGGPDSNQLKGLKNRAEDSLKNNKFCLWTEAFANTQEFQPDSSDSQQYRFWTFLTSPQMV